MPTQNAIGATVTAGGDAANPPQWMQALSLTSPPIIEVTSTTKANSVRADYLTQCTQAGVEPRTLFVWNEQTNSLERDTGTGWEYVGGQQDITATQTGTTWAGYYELTRVSHQTAILSGHFHRATTDFTLSPQAAPSSVGLNPNSVLPSWAQITGTRMGATGFYTTAVSGGGVNATVDVTIGSTGSLSIRSQTQIVFTPSVFVYLPSVAVRIAG